MARYSDEERAQAVALLQAEGYPEKIGALTIVSERLSIPKRTLSRWARGDQNPPPAKLVTEKRRDLATIFRDEIYEIIGVLPERRDQADYRALVTALGILTDKMRLIDGDVTDRSAITFRVVYDDGSDDTPEATA